MNRPLKRKSTFKCPDCGSACRITTTKALTATYKEFYGSCVNDACGGRYVFAGEPIRILVPSLTPNKNNHLPIHNHKPEEKQCNKV